MYDDVWVLFTLKHVYQVQYHCGGPKWLMPDLVFSTHTQCPEGNNMFGGYGWSLKHRAVFENKFTDYTRAYHGNFTGSQELNWSYFNTNKYKRTVKTQKMNQDEQVASHGCPWCRKVPTWFPHLLRWFSNRNSQLMKLSPAPSWSGTSTLGQNTSASPRSDAPFGCPRPGLESDNFGAEKKHHVKRMDRAKKHENHL
jgi:hypothetical protein